MTPVDLCMRANGCRGIASLTQDRKGLPSHKCSFCSHSTRYPEVLWMHQTVAHRINSSSSNLAPKWALKNSSKGSRDNLLSPRRRTGPPPMLEGKECPSLPPLMRAQRTQPPTNSIEVPKKSKPASQAAMPSSSSSSTPSSSTSRVSSSTSGTQAVRVPVRPGSSSKTSSSVRHMEDQSHQSRFRPKVDIYPRGGSSSSSSSLEKSTGAASRSSAPSPSTASASRISDCDEMPQEGLGFMLSSKHGLAEYSRARGSPHQPLPNAHGQSRRLVEMSSRSQWQRHQRRQQTFSASSITTAPMNWLPSTTLGGGQRTDGSHWDDEVSDAAGTVFLPRVREEFQSAQPPAYTYEIPYREK
ncbi:Zinc finger protein 516, partial [Dissostichus eleginoides]